jgi:hypothetical protein
MKFKLKSSFQFFLLTNTLVYSVHILPSSKFIYGHILIIFTYISGQIVHTDIVYIHDFKINKVDEKKTLMHYPLQICILYTNVLCLPLL